MEFWGRRAELLKQDDTTAAPLGTAAEARRRRAAAALRRDLPKFASVTAASPDRAEPREPPSALPPPPRRFPHRGDLVAPEALHPFVPESLAQQAPRHEVSSPDAPPAPALRRRFPERLAPQGEQPAASAIAEMAPLFASLPPRRLTPSQRRAATQAAAEPGPSETLQSQGTALPGKPEPQKWLRGWLGGARSRAKAETGSQPKAVPILDFATIPVPVPILGPSRQKRVPDLLGALLAKREATVLPPPPALTAFRPRPALRYPRPALPRPSLAPEGVESSAAADATERPAPTKQPAEHTSTPTKAAPARQRSATFLSPMPQCETPCDARSPGNHRKTLRGLAPGLFGKPLATATGTTPARQAEQALAQSCRAAPPPVPPGLPTQPLAARLLQILRPPRSLPMAGQRLVAPQPSPQRPPPPGEPLRGAIPCLVNAPQPKASARAVPRSVPELLRQLLPHRHAMEMLPEPVADPVPLAAEGLTLSLGPWLVRAQPEGGSQTDVAGDVPTAVAFSTHDATAVLRG